MKVLYDHQIFTISEFGGASRYFYELIKRAAKAEGIEVSVFMGFFINGYGLENYKKDFKLFTGRKHRNYAYSKLAFLYLNSLYFPRFYNKVSPDIYHQTYYENLCVNKKGKRIVTILDMLHELFPRDFGKLDKSSRNKKTAVKNADGIISISQSTKKDLVEMFGIPEEKIRVIYLASSLSETGADEPTVKPPYLFYVSKRGGYKNFKILVDVFVKLKKNYPELRIVCSGGGSFTPGELSYFEKYGIRDAMVNISADDRVLANLYKYAEALVYPSKYEGFGLPPLEAMTLSCPVIASSLSSIPEVVGDAGIYINPDDAEDIERKIEMLLNDKALRKELVQKGLIQKDKFSWGNTSKETIEYYKEVLGNY